MGADDLPAEGQAKARPSRGALALGLYELVEDPWLQLIRNPGPVIGH